MDDGGTLDRIEELVDEEHRLLRGHVGEGLDADRHARLEAVQEELDRCWDLLRRRRAGQAERLADATVPNPPNDLEGPEPEPLHLEHGVHGDQPAPA